MVHMYVGQTRITAHIYFGPLTMYSNFADNGARNLLLVTMELPLTFSEISENEGGDVM